MNFNFLRMYFAADVLPSRRETVAAFAVAAVSAYLMLFNLEYAALWHDEGVNAVIARNFAANGTFSGWDGRNLFFGIDDFGRGVNKNLNAVSYPPWPVIPSALGVLLFGGGGEFAVRFPHALLGVLCLPVLWALLRMNFPARPRLRLLAFAMFALSPIVILYMRQGRYYADAVLFSLLCVYCYQKYWTGGRVWWLVGLMLFTVLNFLNHFAIGVSAALAIAAWHLILHWRETALRQWLEMSAAAVFVAACCGGYLLWAGIIGGDSTLEYGGDLYVFSWIKRRFVLMKLYFRDTVRTGWLPWWTALWWCWFIFARRIKRAMPQKGGKETAENSAGDGAAARRWALLAALMIAASALVSVQPPGKHVLSDMRYMVFALPFIIFMSAAFADWAWAKNKIAGGVLAAVLIFSHLAVRPFAVDEVHKTVFRCPTEHFPLPSLVREIHRPYPSSAGEAAAYLRKNAAQDDTIFVRPWADYAVLLYYLSDKLIFCCGLDEDAGLPREKIRALGAPVYKSDAWPTWLVLFGGATAEAIEHELFGRYRKRYEGAAFSYPTHRPELEYRCFEQNTGGPFVSIYRRVN